jgi:hypothetical protein
MTTPPPCTKTPEIELYPSHTVNSVSHLTPGAAILPVSLWPLILPPLVVLMRSLPPFPLYSLAGAVDGGIGGGEDRSGNCGNVGTARTGVGDLPGVLSTKVLVLIRCEGVTGTLSISGSGIIAPALPLASLVSPYPY